MQLHWATSGTLFYESANQKPIIMEDCLQNSKQQAERALSKWKMQLSGPALRAHIHQNWRGLIDCDAAKLQLHVFNDLRKSWLRPDWNNEDDKDWPESG